MTTVSSILYTTSSYPLWKDDFPYFQADIVLSMETGLSVNCSRHALFYVVPCSMKRFNYKNTTAESM